jgi:formylglycine-generating enzyme required for sulfatase activity
MFFSRSEFSEEREMSLRKLAAAFLASLIVGTGALSWKVLSADDEPAPRKLAFLVGVKSYDHADLKNLEFPENDVKELADVLKRQGFTVTLMSTSAARTDKEHFPDADNIRLKLSATLKGATKRDLILIGLAGHGLQPLNASQSYFCPHNANPSERNGDVAHPETLLSIGEVLTQIRDSGIGQKLLLVDACRNDPGVRGSRRGAGTIQVDISALPQQTGVLLSCARGEFSFESKSFGTGHGAFFFQVIEGLNGGAKDEDGEITWDTLRTFVKKRVPATVRKVFGKDGGEQSPNEIGNLTGEPPVLAIARIVAPAESKPQPPTPKTMGPTTKPTPGKEPDLLVAPFGADEARTARKAWAQYQQIEEEPKNSIGMKLTLIPAGEFQMGSTPADVDKVLRFDSRFKKEFAANEQPQHHVRITRPFYLGTFEVTNGEFRRFVDDTAYKTDAEKNGKGGRGYTGNEDRPIEQRPNFTWRDWGVEQTDGSPVVNVSHNDAIAFCHWLTQKEGKQYRLPTEAEWEYACRAGTISLYYNGDDPEGLTRIGNMADATLKEKVPRFATVSSSDGWAFTAPVGQFPANNFGAHDMTGNVWEWCSDWCGNGFYLNSPLSDPLGPSSGSLRVSRGGSWNAAAGLCRSAARSASTPGTGSAFVGFRVALSPSAK